MAEFTTVGAFSHDVHIMVDGSGSRERGKHGGRGLTFKAPPLGLALATTPGDLSVISKNHVRGGENQFLQVVL